MKYLIDDKFYEIPIRLRKNDWLNPKEVFGIYDDAIYIVDELVLRSHEGAFFKEYYYELYLRKK